MTDDAPFVAADGSSGEPVWISAPQGRSMLNWTGKRALRSVHLAPFQLVEIHDRDASDVLERPPAAPACLQQAARQMNLLFHADNKDMLACLLANGFRGQIKLIYIDPPFDSAADYVRKVNLRGATSEPAPRRSNPSLGKQVQYTDVWARDHYLQFMYERLLMLRELLAEDGVLWVHCDHRRVHDLHLVLEEVFGTDNYLNTISWRSQVARGAKVNAFYFPYSTHYLEIFARNKQAPPTWNPIKKEVVLTEAEAAAAYMRDERGFFRTSDPGSYSFERLKALHAEGRLYAPYGGEVVVDEATRCVFASNGGNIGVKYYLKPAKGGYVVERAVDNLWDDIPGLGTTPGEDSGYPTQKTEALLRRVITVSTNPGDWVLDCFAGSGTTLAVAQQMGRRWIGGDVNRGAIQTIVRRLRAWHQSPGLDSASKGVRSAFAIYCIGGASSDWPAPRTETRKRIYEYLSIRRVSADPFFDGMRGRQWVKIAPLTHPLSVADLEAVHHELAARSGQARDVLIVCWGKQPEVDGWLQSHRRVAENSALGAIQVIDLRSDRSARDWFTHQPAQARVRALLDRGAIAPVVRVTVEDFTSPAVVQRLNGTDSAAVPRLADWRAVVDSIMIDPSYDGVVFRPALVDAPRKRSELVRGCYEWPAPSEPAIIAVRLTDVLGEETLVILEIASREAQDDQPSVKSTYNRRREC
ncbi:MAG: site-specific DNA-methyltransferase [Anaerolineae bacterium]|nr:site-specific DNA-methyltransferase [Thermoflexales bacterium]MDW8408733.1 site-specific DNA-methyltransferase [Anaerolineae bacterium]